MTIRLLMRKCALTVTANISAETQNELTQYAGRDILTLEKRRRKMEKKYDKTYPLSVLQDLINEIDAHTDAINRAAEVLVDSVEKYVRQECSRSTLLSMKDKLKELLEK